MGLRIRCTSVATSGSFDLTGLLAARGAERYELQAKRVNPQLTRMLHTIGFDKIYTRAEGPYLYDDEGNEYLDMLAEEGRRRRASGG